METSVSVDSDHDGKSSVEASVKLEGTVLVLTQKVDLLELGDEAWNKIQELRAKKA